MTSRLRSRSRTKASANPGIKLQFSEIDKYADLEGCKPKCSVDIFLGMYATLPGIPAGKTKTYQVNFIATKVGAIHWSVCVYDDETRGEQVHCGDATTIR